MPGIVKIGMTDRDDVRRRMSDLYTTGVPLPFDCVVAREIDGRELDALSGWLALAIDKIREYEEVGKGKAQLQAET